MRYSRLVRQKQLRKALLFVLLSVSDYKRLDTSSYFIITSFHTELKPQVNVEPWHETFTVYTTMVVGRGGVEGGHGPSLHLEIWHFPMKCSAKKIVFIVSIRKNEISRFCPPYENSWLYMDKSIFQCPCTRYVWLIVGNWWTILLWSGSTKGWSRAGSAILLICTEVFLWLTHQKLDYPENFWCNFWNWGEAISPPGYAPMCMRQRCTGAGVSEGLQPES